MFPCCDALTIVSPPDPLPRLHSTPSTILWTPRVIAHPGLSINPIVLPLPVKAFFVAQISLPTTGIKPVPNQSHDTGSLLANDPIAHKRDNVAAHPNQAHTRFDLATNGFRIHSCAIGPVKAWMRLWFGGTNWGATYLWWCLWPSDRTTTGCNDCWWSVMSWCWL